MKLIYIIINSSIYKMVEVHPLAAPFTKCCAHSNPQNPETRLGGSNKGGRASFETRKQKQFPLITLCVFYSPWPTILRRQSWGKLSCEPWIPVLEVGSRRLRQHWIHSPLKQAQIATNSGASHVRPEHQRWRLARSRQGYSIHGASCPDKDD
jgi:hypothetical protein